MNGHQMVISQGCVVLQQIFTGRGSMRCTCVLIMFRYQGFYQKVVNTMCHLISTCGPLSEKTIKISSPQKFMFCEGNLPSGGWYRLQFVITLAVFPCFVYFYLGRHYFFHTDKIYPVGVTPIEPMIDITEGHYGSKQLKLLVSCWHYLDGNPG